MSTSYSVADPDKRVMLADVMQEHHRRLVRADVRVGLLEQISYDKDGRPVPSLKQHGYPAIAVTSLTNVKQRLLGMPDACIVVDDVTWRELDDVQRLSLLDHELCHIEVKDEGGRPVTDEDEDIPHATDDACRPKLGMRRHDIQLGTFREPIQHYGTDAVDAQAIATVIERANSAHEREPEGPTLYEAPND